MFYKHAIHQLPLRQKITDAYRMDETECVEHLLSQISFTPDQEAVIQKRACEVIAEIREGTVDLSGIEAFMHHYDLSSEEGVLLMCLAEALLRVPDKATEDLLIKDKLTSAEWEKHLGESESTFVNAATWGLSMTRKLLDAGPQQKTSGFFALLKKLIRKSGEPVIRQAVREMMKILSHQFVLGRTIDEALKESKKYQQKGYRFSYDMLGEVARTQADADRYYTAYKEAIIAVGRAASDNNVFANSGVSVKLSALYPRYEFAKHEQCVSTLIKRLKELSLLAKAGNIGLTVDAEEAERLDISFDILEQVMLDPELKDWNGLGLALQAYQKRAFYAIDWLVDLAKRAGKKIPLRLVKGAYWDTEIKLTQVGGYKGYPVFTRKVSTDLSYLACAKKILENATYLYPQFATHNAYSFSAILEMVENIHPHPQFEFQNLHGMGKNLHDKVVGKYKIPSRIYAPVGIHKDLLPYLVRRLLENGANSSFINKIMDPKVSVQAMVENPVTIIQGLTQIPHPKIPLPEYLYGKRRKNSAGIDLTDINELHNLQHALEAAGEMTWRAHPTNVKFDESQAKPVFSPQQREHIVGHLMGANEEMVKAGIERAAKAYDSWDALGVVERSRLLSYAADLLQEHHAELVYLAIYEAGKTVADAIADVREAIDFCRYYAYQARTTLAPQQLPGPTGESNLLSLHGRGVFICISPWNFPVAIFTGQVAAALVTGNTVLAKPAEQTPLTAALVVKLFHEAGFPKDVLQLMPGRGSKIGNPLVLDPRVAGVVFTGSNDTAKTIHRNLASRDGIIPILVAETGGLNAMIADSTALAEQLVGDVLTSAFSSAGQRCSALRVLFIQDDIADHVIEMLKGAMAQLEVGMPDMLASDLGPVIDESALKTLNEHRQRMLNEAKLIYEVKLPADCEQGYFIPPQAYELESIRQLKQEVFGPILHVIRYARNDLEKVIDEVNGMNFGLTFGIQSRIDEVVDAIQSKIRAGNVYVNRNMIGAVVGVQPFGGRNLSGTGPKAGGPHYLSRLCTEKTLTINTTASGGNASLMTLED